MSKVARILGAVVYWTAVALFWTVAGPIYPIVCLWCYVVNCAIYYNERRHNKYHEPEAPKFWRPFD